jgi:hypothetical protein
VDYAGEAVATAILEFDFNFNLADCYPDGVPPRKTWSMLRIPVPAMETFTVNCPQFPAAGGTSPFWFGLFGCSQINTLRDDQRSWMALERSGFSGVIGREYNRDVETRAVRGSATVTERTTIELQRRP